MLKWRFGQTTVGVQMCLSLPGEVGRGNALRSGQDEGELTTPVKCEGSHSRARDHHTQKPENRRQFGLSWEL